MSTSPISITLADKNIKKMDEIRGLIKRSTFIDGILSDFFNNQNSEGKKSPQPKDSQSSKSRSVS